MTNTALRLGSGACWALAYVLILRRGASDRAYGMPIAAAAANLSWELIFSLLTPMAPPQRYVNWTWLALDLPIVWQCYVFGREEWARQLGRRGFTSWFLFALVSAFALVWLVSREFASGARYAAFGQNLMMSALFIEMLLRRGSTRGQSAAIAALKLLGTALAGLNCLLEPRPSSLIAGLAVAILALDAAYLAMVVKASRTGSAAFTGPLVRPPVAPGARRSSRASMGWAPRTRPSPRGRGCPSGGRDPGA